MHVTKEICAGFLVCQHQAVNMDNAAVVLGATAREQTEACGLVVADVEAGSSMYYRTTTWEVSPGLPGVRLATMGILEACVYLLLLTVLAPLGRRLVNDTREANAASQTQIADPQFVFQTENGIDVTGSRVSPIPPPNIVRTVIFVLRAKSLSDDVNVWNGIYSRLPQHSGVRLVAYCDTDQCISQLQRRQQVPYTVIAYGEIVSAQAILQADINGDYLVRSEAWYMPRHHNWRSGESSVERIVETIVSDR